MQNYAADSNSQPITYGRLASDIGGIVVNGGYSGNRIARLKLDPLKCGIKDFEKVIQEYGILFKIADIDEKYITESIVQGRHPLRLHPGELMPEALEYTLEDFRNMINTALSCVVSEPEAFDLNLQIRKLIGYLQTQLEFRTNLFDRLNEDFSPLV